MSALQNNLKELEPLLVAELKRLRATIGKDDNCTSAEPGDPPGMDVTLGINDDASEYALQTGDNSFTGAAYGFPHWGNSSLMRDATDSDVEYVAREIIRQCEELAA